MSLENGTNILDYEDLKNCLEKYSLDNKIFEKAAIMLSLYMNQPSWPHSFNLFESECSSLLGGSPYWIGRIGGQIISHFNNDENSKIDDSFKRDLEFFSINTWILLDNAYYDRSNPLGLSSIASSINDNNSVIIKISRSDKTSLELSLSKNELIHMIQTLTNLVPTED